MSWYEDRCECGYYYDDKGKKQKQGDTYPGGLNCAHFLTNWMIKNGYLEPYPAGCKCCDSGRPIRANEVLKNIFEARFTNEKNPTGNCYVYCRPSRGHVYYGTKDNCVAGTGAYPNSSDHKFFNP